MAEPLDAGSPYLVEGLRLFREGQYFLAHETLEELWAEAPGPERPFLQGLIQLATGFHHLVRGNLAGAALQFGKARARLDGYPSPHLGVDVAAARSFLDDARTRLDAREPAAIEGIRPPELGS